MMDKAAPVTFRPQPLENTAGCQLAVVLSYKQYIWLMRSPDRATHAEVMLKRPGALGDGAQVHEVAVASAGAGILLVLPAGGFSEVRHGAELAHDGPPGVEAPLEPPTARMSTTQARPATFTGAAERHHQHLGRRHVLESSQALCELGLGHAPVTLHPCSTTALLQVCLLLGHAAGTL